MQAGTPPISRPPLAIDEYRFAESRAVHPPAFKFCRTWDRSRPWSSCSPVPHFGVLEYHRLQQGGGFIVVLTALNDSDGQHQHFDIKPAHHASWLVAAEYTTPSARQSHPRQEPNLHALLYQNQKEFSVWQATTESCRATPSREQPPSHAPSQMSKFPHVMPPVRGWMHMLAISRRHPNGTALSPPNSDHERRDNVPLSHSLGEILSRSGCSLLRYPDSRRPIVQLSNPSPVPRVSRIRRLGPRPPPCFHSRLVGRADPARVGRPTGQAVVVCHSTDANEPDKHHDARGDPSAARL